MTLLDRIDRWHRYATATGKKLTRIVIHPQDIRNAPAEFKGLPVVALGEQSI